MGVSYNFGNTGAYFFDESIARVAHRLSNYSAS